MNQSNMSEKLNQPLHLLIDGADKLGKTTVIQLLSRQLNLPVIKMPESKRFIEGDNIEVASKFFNQVVTQFQEYSFIMDRGFPSSIVYSKVFNREVDLSYIENVEGILKCRVVILVGSMKSVDDIEAVNEKWHRINQMYTDLAGQRGYVLINVDGLTPIEVCNKILESL